MDKVFMDRPIMTISVLCQALTLALYGMSQVEQGNPFGWLLIAFGFNSAVILDWVYNFLKKSEEKSVDGA